MCKTTFSDELKFLLSVIMSKGAGPDDIQNMC